MASYLDSVPFSGIIRIRDMMYTVENPFRLDQGDVSFDAPSSVKDAIVAAVRQNHTHYLQTTGLPRLRDLLAAKLRAKNAIPVDDPDEIMVTNGGIHGLYMACQALLEPGDEVVIPDPEWPPCAGNILAARAVPVGCPLHEDLGWRYDLDELRARITPRTRAIYINSPHNPTGGLLTREDLGAIASLARERDVWIISDEAYEDIVFDGAAHVSIASLADAYDRTISVFTLSKTYAITGLRLGYVVARDATIRNRMKKVLFYTASNVASVVQYGGIGGLEGSHAFLDEFRRELQARRDLFFDGIGRVAAGVLSGNRPAGAFYAFLRISPEWAPPGPDGPSSISWAMVEHLIRSARIGCVPGVDFGPNGEGYIRFCFARDRQELAGAIESLGALFDRTPAASRRV